MKLFVSVFLAMIVIFSVVGFTQESSVDDAAIKAAVADYVEGIYEVAPERIERSVDVTLRKYGYGWRKDKGEYWRGNEMNYKQLYNLAANWNAKGRVDAKTAPKEITILDKMDKTASAKLVASWGIDYFHLAKEDGQWKIVNVLWQAIPPAD